MMGRVTTTSSCFIHFALTKPFRRITQSARLLRFSLPREPLQRPAQEALEWHQSNTFLA